MSIMEQKMQEQIEGSLYHQLEDAYEELKKENEELKQRLEAGQHETIVMRWERGKPPTDDYGCSVDVLGAIPTKKCLTTLPVRLDGGEWHWVESGKKISEEYIPVKWMYYPNT